ncbi:MAG: hypothetical protein ACE148_05705 [Vicinamibacterales bacterium]
MKLLSLTVALGVCALAADSPASAGEVKLQMKNGRVTLEAHNATAREILAEWARVGGTRILNAERVPGGPMTLILTDVPESKALDTVLRSVSGYMAAPRPATVPGASVYDRIVILATVRQAPAPGLAGPAPVDASQRFRPGRSVRPDEQEEMMAPNPGFPGSSPNMTPGANPGMPVPADPGAGQGATMPGPAGGAPVPSTPGAPGGAMPGGLPAGASPVPGVIVQPKPPVKPPGPPDGQ